MVHKLTPPMVSILQRQIAVGTILGAVGGFAYLAYGTRNLITFVEKSLLDTYVYQGRIKDYYKQLNEGNVVPYIPKKVETD
jgi:hypothetical protein